MTPLVYFGQVKVHSERRLFIPAPLGLPCLYCGLYFKAGDSGLVLPWSTDDEGEASGAYHLKCFSGDVLGLSAKDEIAP